MSHAVQPGVICADVAMLKAGGGDTKFIHLLIQIKSRGPRPATVKRLRVRLCAHTAFWARGKCLISDNRAPKPKSVVTPSGTREVSPAGIR